MYDPPHKCDRPAPFTSAEGKPRCKIHSDEYITKKHAEQDARDAAERAQTAAVTAIYDAKTKLANLMPMVLVHVPEGPLHNEIVRLLKVVQPQPVKEGGK